MKLEKSIFQRSHYFFIVFFGMMLIAFWLSYFVQIFDQENYRMHTHGITLILWCLMLIIQPFLIRTRRRALHRFIGKFSYLLVPLMIFTTMDLLRFRLKAAPALHTMDYFFVSLVVNALIVFLLLYGLAIINRKKSTIHARYMICTAFPMFTPITDRIVYTYFPSLLKYVPTIDANPIAPAIGFGLADFMLIGLSIWDWRSHKRWNVFPVALSLLLLYHFSVFNFYKYAWWQQFSTWLANS